MLITPDLMRVVLLLGMLAMVMVAAFYLRQRKLSAQAYAIWGLIAILFPIVGPFFVIWIRPGGKRIQIKP